MKKIYQIFEEIPLPSQIMTDADISDDLSALSSNLRKLIPPFTDHIIETDVSISVVNFNVNDILAEHDWEYGESASEKKNFKLSVFIPVTVDQTAEFNEFYLNFILKNSTLSTEFRLMDENATLIPNMPSSIVNNTSFHFYENKSGDYDIKYFENIEKRYV